MSLTQDAARAGAVNTLWMKGKDLWGALTDVDGIRLPLEAAGYTSGRALILGAGGAARAACIALSIYDVPVDVAARVPERAEPLTKLAGNRGQTLSIDTFRSLEQYSLIIQATPVGRDGSHHNLLWASVRPKTIAFEMLYSSRHTPFLDAAKTHGCTLIQGWEMLLAQGARSFEIWTGQKAPVKTMENAILGALRD